MEDIKKEVLRIIDKNKKEEIAFLRKLVSTPSINTFVANPLESRPDEPIEKEVANLIFAKLREIGLRPKKIGVSKERPNIVASIGNGKRVLIFNGHMDTVIPSSRYTFNPLKSFIKDGRVYGVGALDMKSVLAAYIFVAKALFEFKNMIGGKICFQFVVDEEPMAASEFGTAYLLKSGFTGEAAVVGETGDHKITIGNKGGYRFKIEIFGEAAHTGSREWELKKTGKNAILAMSEVIKTLSEFEFPKMKEHPIFSGRKNVLTFPTEISGGKAINIVPDYCVAYGDTRILPGVDDRFMEKGIRAKLDKLGIDYKLTKIIYVPPAVVDKNQPLVQIVRKNAKAVLGKEPILEGSGPWSDLWMFVEKGIPAINFGCRGGGLHAPDEYVEIKSVIDITKVYALSAIDFLST